MITLSSTARAGETGDRALSEFPKKDSPEAVEIHGDEIWMWRSGRFEAVSRMAAIAELATLQRGDDPVLLRKAAALRRAIVDTHNDYYFRAPRHGDLVVCPYCDADTFDCDHCGGERRLYADEVFPPCDSPQAYHSDGVGGNPPSPGETRRSMKTNPTPGSSRSESLPTGSGRKARTSPPASGGNRAKSTPRPATFSHPKSAAPKSTDAAPTLGELGHG